jgi:hypothetical protein
VSAVSEYGFDFDFPLTPPVWLVIAIGVVVMATTHNVIGSRIHSRDKCETGNHRLVNAALLSESIRPTSMAGNCRAIAPFAVRPDGKISASEALARPAYYACLVAGDDIAATLLLGPATNRGPPGVRDSNPSVPTPPHCAALRTSAFAVEVTVPENYHPKEKRT